MKKTINIKTRTGIIKQKCYEPIIIGDYNAYHLVIEMMDIEAITGTVLLRFVRSDNVTIETVIPAEDVVGNKIYHTMTQQETEVESPLLMYVRFSESNLYTPTLIVFVNVRPLAGHDLTPTEEDEGIIDQIIAAEEARVAAEAIRVSNEENRVENENGRTTAEGLRAGAESGRVSAEGLRVAAEGLRVNAESSRNTAEGLRVTAEEDRVEAENNRAVWEPFDPLKEYAVGNKVAYEGSSYIVHTSPPIGTLPTNTAYFTLIAAKGDPGEVSTAQLEAAIDTHDTDETAHNDIRVEVATKLTETRNTRYWNRPAAYRIQVAAGRFNMSWNNASGRMWIFPAGTVLYSDGVTPIRTSTAEKPDVTIPAGGGYVWLVSAMWNGLYSLSDNDTNARITGSLADLPPLTYYLNLSSCSLVTGSLADLPPLTNYLNLYNCSKVTGSYSAVNGTDVPTTTILSYTGLSAADMDATLIAYAACTKDNGTFTATGKTRTAASDAAVATLTGRGWTINGITKV